jgi:hypothetical protein
MDTFFRALTAGIGADAAVFHSHQGMLITLFRTGSADIRAQLAKGIYIFPIHLHDLRSGAADRGAFQVQPDAFSQLLHIFFFQAGGCTLVAHAGAIDASVYTGLIFYIRRHNLLF